MLFGEKSKPPKPPPTEATSGSDGRGQSEGGAGSSSHDAHESDDGRGVISEPTGEPSSEQEGGDETQTDETEPRPGPGRLSIETYSASERVECRHQDLAPSDRCPVCGIGWLYSLPPGQDLRINGHAVLSAIRYEVETLRCSACGELDALQELYAEHALRFTDATWALEAPTAFDPFVKRLRRHKWVVYAKPPFGGPEQTLNYLGRYTHRVAISNYRLLDLQGD